ncbi:MAG: hypothetical protein ACO3LB_08650 [Flavobacteriaceae bacterium]|jgi:hypothetical protein
MNIYFDSMGSFQTPIKKELINTLVQTYGEVSLAQATHDPLYNAYLATNIKNAENIFIWNGSELGCFWVIDICKAFDKRYCIFERGLFPQAENNLIVDKTGICCRSTSLQEKYCDKTQLDFESISKHYKNLGLKRLEPKEKYVFVFQLEFDSTVYHYSNYQSNEVMVDEYVGKNNINPDSVVICPHPRNKNIESKYKISTEKTIVECQDAKKAIGISSTTLYEIMGLGCPVDVLGGNKDLAHPINREWSDKKYIIPTILQNQFYLTSNKKSIRSKIEKNLER